MDSDKYIFAVLIAANLTAGFGCAVPIARGLCRINNKPKRTWRYFAMLIGIYFIECVAFTAGMCTQVFTVGLAFVWGIIFGLWLQGRVPKRKVLKQAVLAAVYGSLPTASFGILIPVIWLIGGGHILSAEEGIGFGIPELFPWPLNTILGFCTALVIGTAVLKTVITTGIVSLLIHLRENSAVNRSSKRKNASACAAAK